ncbi:dTMP kinase [Pseudonocardia sp. TRM90224]|uniref:dTMP kinase n=1 Tax=Pseudonocardia sp. TRM90224 TaxID=2812678 RepID=UPI001E2F0852|nr:dTMP kinase [Pseudonocardia sp. TRM90224]
MGRLVVIEGLDGAGKRTLSDALSGEFAERGARVARFAFPRYDADVHAELAREALYGHLGDLVDSVYGMAALFALDRRAAAPQMRAAINEHEVVLVDRYVASSAAYCAARLRQDADGPFVEWLEALELARFGVPVPDHQILLAVPRDVAAERAARRERTEPGRGRDLYESDDGLQRRTGEIYSQLASRSWLSPWAVVDGAAEPDAAALAKRLLG